VRDHRLVITSLNRHQSTRPVRIVNAVKILQDRDALFSNQLTQILLTAKRPRQYRLAIFRADVALRVTLEALRTDPEFRCERLPTDTTSNDQKVDPADKRGLLWRSSW
jgi:hypothetical protein